MDLLSLVQWLGAVCAFGGAVIVAWPDGAEPASPRRLLALAGAGALVAFLLARWLRLDDDASAAKLRTAAAELAGLTSLVAVVVLVLLLNGAASAAGWYRAGAVLCTAGFGVALLATAQVALIGEPWTASGWVWPIALLVACGTVFWVPPRGDSAGQ